MGKTLAIITARGGSKRIPGKNIKEFCGRPILAYSIQAALDSGVFDEVMVSTDGEGIAAVAREFGASVPFYRSEATSNDYATTADVLMEVIAEYEKLGRKFDYFACLYPTAPFVTADKLKNAFNALRVNQGQCLIPVVRFSYPPQRGFIIEDGIMRYQEPENFRKRSQDLQGMYHDCGQFYFYKTDAFIEKKGEFLEGIIPFEMLESEMQDIDTPQDWEIAEQKYRRLTGDCGQADVKTEDLRPKACEESISGQAVIGASANPQVAIDGRVINENSPAFIIAEMSANHLMDFERAKEIIRAAKECGADAIKLQTYTADTITMDCDSPYFQITQGTIWDGTTLYKLYKEAYTPWEWQPELKKYADELGIICFSSPFDKTAVDFMEQMDMPAYKIASFEITDIPLIKEAASKKKPVIISTGIAYPQDIERAITACRQVGNEQVVFLKCTSAYPAPYEDINLNTIPDMAKRYNCICGLSDHTMGSAVAVAAVALGAKVIEKHLTLRRSDGGADAAFSMEPEEFKRMVEEIRIVEKSLGKVSYELTDKQKKSREHCRSLFVTKDIKAGEVFTTENLRSIRPGYGLSTVYYEEILGQTAARDIAAGTPMEWEFVRKQ